VVERDGVVKVLVVVELALVNNGVTLVLVAYHLKIPAVVLLAFNASVPVPHREVGTPVGAGALHVWAREQSV
jgi:hypothetical protein